MITATGACGWLRQARGPRLRLSLLAVPLVATAQTPSAIDVMRIELFRQISSAELRPESARLAVTVTFPSVLPAGATVRIRTPRDTVLPLDRQPDGSFVGSRTFASETERDAQFPEGVQAFLVGAGGADTTTNFAVFNTAAVSPARVTNFAELQALPGSSATVQWTSITDARRGDALSLVIARGDGTAVGLVPAALDAESSFAPVTGLPLFTALTGTLAYARTTTTTVLNAGATRATVRRGFSVQFTLQASPAPPVIAAQPATQVAAQGAEVRLVFDVRSPAALTYQWSKDGVPIPGATNRELQLRNVQVSDAGRYSATATGSTGQVTSEAALLAVAPAFRFKIHAGTPTRPGSADGPANVGRLQGPTALALDLAGNLYVADTGNSAIRRASPAGELATFAGLVGPGGFADGPSATARFSIPRGVAVDAAGNVFVADTGNHVIRRISPAGMVSTFAGAPGQPESVDGPAAQARFRSPYGVAVDGAGNVFVADLGNSTIRRITPAGVVSTLAGMPRQSGSVDGIGAAARLSFPNAIAIDPAGVLWVTEESDGVLRKIMPSGAVTTFAINPSFRVSNGIAVDGTGAVYLSSGFGAILRLTAEGTFGGGAIQPYKDFVADLTSLNYFSPIGLTVDRQGALFVADPGNACVLKADFVAGSAPGLVIVSAPVAQQVVAGGSVAMSVTATGPGINYQWRKDGVPIPGATAAQFFLSRAAAADAGGYSVVVGNGAGAIISAMASLTVVPAEAGGAGRLVNLSVRTRAGTGAATLIVGLTVGGAGARPLLVRGIGPALASFGIGGFLGDPNLTIYRGSQVISDNDNWGGAPALIAAFSAVGAFPLAPASLDAAVMGSFSVGSYSVQVEGRGSASGVALAEIYEAPGGSEAAGARLINVSARAAVGTGADVLIAGFAIAGPSSRSVIIRAVGPTLAAFGVNGALEDPTLRIFANGVVIAANDNWNREPALTAAFSAVGAFPLSSSRDAALLITLPPGSYSAQVAGVGETTGVALVEVYEVP